MKKFLILSAICTGLMVNTMAVYAGNTTGFEGKSLVKLIEKALEEDNSGDVLNQLKNDYFKDSDGLDSLKSTAQIVMSENEDKLENQGISKNDVYDTIDNLKKWDKESRMELLDLVDSGKLQDAAKLIENDGEILEEPTTPTGGGQVVDPNTGEVIKTPIEETTEELKLKFDDINDHWAKDSIVYMTDTGIVSGINDKEFNPDGNINRAEIATLMVKILKIDEKQVIYMPFEDINMDDWYFKFVRAAFGNNIVSGISETKFSPKDNITREQIITMAMNTLKNKGVEIAVNKELLDKYKDKEKISSWAIDYIAQGEEFGIVLSGENLNPQENVTRAEAVWILEKVYKIINK